MPIFIKQTSQWWKTGGLKSLYICEKSMEKHIFNALYNESGVYVRGVTTEQKQTDTAEQNTISIPTGINFIFDSMFANRGLTEITIPERITFIGNNAFANNQISNVLIPNNVTSIGSGAFSNNPLVRVTIGANVHIDDDAIPGYFANFYNDNGKTIGTYTRANVTSNEWRKQ